MIHEPFETWILSGTELSIEEKAALHNHLQECSQCWTLGHNWRNIRTQISGVSMAEPAQGFGQRWKASADARRELKQRNQIMRLFLSMGVMAFISLLTLAVQFVLAGSPIDWVMRTAENSVHYVLETAKVTEAFVSMIKIVPPTIALATWGILAAGFSGLCMLWAYTMWRTSKEGVQNEKVV